MSTVLTQQKQNKKIFKESSCFYLCAKKYAKVKSYTWRQAKKTAVNLIQGEVVLFLFL